nr:phage major capsid protein [Rhodococcus wratislaviensis]GLK38662.1 hypothetical protein GCM10017611_55290 [Rhodococcus wratislaviensis]
MTFTPKAKPRVTTTDELQAEYNELRTEAQDLATRGDDLEGADAQRFDTVADRLDELKTELTTRAKRLEHLRDLADAGSFEHGSPQATTRTRATKPALRDQPILTRDQSFVSWNRDNGRTAANSEGASFDRYLRGIVSGDWRGADEERSMSEGTLTAGGHTVPTPLASSVIDLARNASRVVQAGAITVPMTSNTLKVPRLTGEGAPAWRNEGAAITAGDLTFDAVTFTARSLDRLVILSRELFEDSDPSAGNIIAASFAAQIGLELDRVALRGSGSAPEPRGVLNTSGVTITTHGANGAGLTNYDFLLDAAGAVRNSNYEPNAHIVAPRSTTSLQKLKDANGNYLTAPQGLLPILSTKQVPTNLTVGTSSDTSEVFTAQWNALAIGIRTGFEIQFLREKYADTGQYGFIAHLRADVQVLQPSAFVVDTGVRA